MTSDNRWYSVLDDLDAHLNQQADALEAGRPDLIVAFTLPPGIGSVPPNLEPRLDILRRRSAELGAVVTPRRHEDARGLATSPPRRPSGCPWAWDLDTST
jgi:hypothetical protein